MSQMDRVSVLKDAGDLPELPIVESNGKAWAVVWPGVGAELRSFHHISLQATGRTVRLVHPMEAVYYVMRGSAVAIDPDEESRQDLVEGSMAHIEPGTAYVFQAGSTGAEIIGGPCPADHTMYEHLEY
ncbi:MAG: hypothetical protein OEM32_09745 [Acidimicrobiia bacterium]|nr:hypothetical protein [Acidimicrobiia bacterium]